MLHYDLVIPELYQPLVYICIGIWNWLLVITILKWQQININTLIYTSSTTSNQIKPLFIYAVIMTLIISSHISILESLDYFKQHQPFGPAIFCYLLVIFWTMLGPCQQDARKFLLCLHRLFFKLSYHHVYFSDILVADILVSFSFVLTSILIHMIQGPNPPPSCTLLMPMISSIPYVIRFKQCLNEYFNSNHSNTRHLMNALKYVSTIPVIFLSYYSTHLFTANEDLLRHSWISLNLFNHLFAFSWDVIMDWGLLSFENDFRIIVRKDLHFSDPLWYVLAVGLNGSLRVLRMATQVYHIQPICIDLAEVFRRWIWVIFRLEYEFVKHSYIDVEKRIMSTSV